MTTEYIPNPSVRDMISQLSGTNVTAATIGLSRPNMNVRNVYTPNSPFTVNYCGMKDALPDSFQNEPQIVSSVIVTFDKDEAKTLTVKKSIPEIGEDDSLVFYRKKNKKYKQIKSFDTDKKELREMIKRKARNDLVLYLYVKTENVVQNHPPPLDQDNPENTLQNFPPAPAQVTNEDNNIQVHHEDVNEDLNNGDDEMRIDNGTNGAGDLLNQSQEVDFFYPSSRSPAYSNYSGFESDQFRDLELPDPVDCFSWKKITDIPVGREVNLQDVAEADLPSMPKYVREVKIKRETDQEMEINSNPPSEMNSNCSLQELLEKGKLLIQDFADFKSEKKMSSSLLTFLCLIAASEAVEETHLVTPDEVRNIQDNIAPIKPAENIKNIVILNTDDDLPLIALVKMDNGEYYLNSIITINNSKHYVSKLLIRDVCSNLSIDVNYSKTVCKNFLDFSSEDGKKLPSFSLFYSARKMLGLNPPFSVEELEGIIEMAHNRVNELKQTSEVDSEIDWFSIYENSRKRNREAD